MNKAYRKLWREFYEARCAQSVSRIEFIRSQLRRVRNIDTRSDYIASEERIEFSELDASIARYNAS